eukprot:53118-Amorphochlora_amoeboformis.AAC.1
MTNAAKGSRRPPCMSPRAIVETGVILMLDLVAVWCRERLVSKASLVVSTIRLSIRMATGIGGGLGVGGGVGLGKSCVKLSEVAMIVSQSAAAAEVPGLKMKPKCMMNPIPSLNRVTYDAFSEVKGGGGNVVRLYTAVALSGNDGIRSPHVRSTQAKGLGTLDVRNGVLARAAAPLLSVAIASSVRQKACFWSEKEKTELSRSMSGVLNSSDPMTIS